MRLLWKTALNSTDNNLLSIAQEQKSLEELSNAEEARRYYAATDLLDIIKRLRSNNDTVDMLIAIGNYENDVSDASAKADGKGSRCHHRLYERPESGT